MTFWTVFAACMAASLIMAIIGFCIAALTDKLTEDDDKKELEKIIHAPLKPVEAPEPVAAPIHLEHEDRMMLFSDIIETFEDLLDEKGIVIENDEKKENPHATNIYGTDYGDLVDRIERILMSYDLLERER